MVMDCRYAIRTAGTLSLHLSRLFQARLTPAARSRSSLVTQSCFSSIECMVLCSSAPEPLARGGGGDGNSAFPKKEKGPTLHDSWSSQMLYERLALSYDRRGRRRSLSLAHVLRTASDAQES